MNFDSRRERSICENMKENVLFVRHLPSCLTQAEKTDFLKYYGAVDVRVMPSTGRMKHSAFAVYEDTEKAKKALERLHQTEIFNSVLSVEFAKRQDTVPSASATEEQVDSLKNNDEKFNESNGLLAHQKRERNLEDFDAPPRSGLRDYPTNPCLKYDYPEPSGDILINICSALLAVPKLYTQVLHLMNKINLAAPFRPASTIPPSIIKIVKKMCNFNQTSPCDSNEDVDMSESESEYESSSSGNNKHKSLDLEVPKRVVESRKRKKKNVKRVNKRQRLEEMVSSENKKSSTVPAEDITTLLNKRTFAIKIPKEINPKESSDMDAEEEENNTFGKIIPIREEVENPMENPTSNSEVMLKDYITTRQLERGRLRKSEMSDSSIFKNYNPGEATCRLYVKNLSKKVTEKDLDFIFGGFVNHGDENDKNMFSIQLLTQGRMKGQAFIGLPSAEAATKALNATNGYQLIGKPMVVHFARSKKPN